MSTLRRYIVRKLAEAEKRGLDRETLADVCGLTTSAVAQYATGTSQPRLDGMLSIIAALDAAGVSVDLRVPAGVMTDPYEANRRSAMSKMTLDELEACGMLEEAEELGLLDVEEVAQ